MTQSTLGYSEIEGFSNKTIKQEPPRRQVEQLMNKIHEPLNTEEDEDDLADFQPPPPPESSGVSRMKARRSGKKAEENIHPEQIHGVYAGNFNQSTSFQPQEAPPSKQEVDSKIDTKMIMEKLNHVITLLEEQNDEKVNGITEELVLYCFLGVFIIYVIDSFAKVGKYIR